MKYKVEVNRRGQWCPVLSTDDWEVRYFNTADEANAAIITYLYTVDAAIDDFISMKEASMPKGKVFKGIDPDSLRVVEVPDSEAVPTVKSEPKTEPTTEPAKYIIETQGADGWKPAVVTVHTNRPREFDSEEEANKYLDDWFAQIDATATNKAEVPRKELYRITKVTTPAAPDPVEAILTTPEGPAEPQGTIVFAALLVDKSWVSCESVNDAFKYMLKGHSHIYDYVINYYGHNPALPAPVPYHIEPHYEDGEFLSGLTNLNKHEPNATIEDISGAWGVLSPNMSGVLDGPRWPAGMWAVTLSGKLEACFETKDEADKYRLLRILTAHAFQN